MPQCPHTSEGDQKLPHQELPHLLLVSWCLCFPLHPSLSSMGTLPWADGGECPQGCATGSSPSLRSFARLSRALLFLSHPKPGRSSRWLLSHDNFRALQQKVLSMAGEDGPLRQRGGRAALEGEGARWLVGQGGTFWDILGHSGALAHSRTVKDPESLKPTHSQKHQPCIPGLFVM